VLSMGVGAGLAHVGAVTLPFQIGAAIDGLGLSATQAGIFGMMELMSIALATTFVAPVVGRVPLVWLAIIGAGLAAIGHLMMYLFATNMFELSMLGILCGAGYGVMFAVTIYAVSNEPDSDRMYALGNAGGLLLIIGVLALFPKFLAHFGVLGPFLGIAVICAVFAPLMVGFRGHEPALVAGGRGAFRCPGGLPLIVIWSVYSLATGLAWSFSERIGTPLFRDHGSIGYFMSATMFVGIIGTLLAAVFGGKINRSRAIFVGMVGAATGFLLFSFANTLIVFAAGVIAYWISSMFLVAYLLGTAAALDPTGRVGATGGGFERFSLALGAPIGGVVLEHWGAAAVGSTACLLCVVAVGVCVAPLSRALRERVSTQSGLAVTEPVRSP
jgi:hypothetical protein